MYKYNVYIYIYMCIYIYNAGLNSIYNSSVPRAVPFAMFICSFFGTGMVDQWPVEVMCPLLKG